MAQVHMTLPQEKKQKTLTGLTNWLHMNPDHCNFQLWSPALSCSVCLLLLQQLGNRSLPAMVTQISTANHGAMADAGSLLVDGDFVTQDCEMWEGNHLSV